MRCWKGNGKGGLEWQWGRVGNEGVHEGSKGREFKKRMEEGEVERRRGEGGLSVKGEGVR